MFYVPLFLLLVFKGFLFLKNWCKLNQGSKIYDNKEKKYTEFMAQNNST